MSLPLAVAAGMIMLNDGYERRLPAKALALVHSQKWPDVGRCLTDYKKDQYHDCTLGAGKAPASILLWGDSHAQTLIWAVTEIAKRQATNIRHVTKGGCPPVFHGVVPTVGIDKQACLNAQRAARAVIESDPHISTVLISARWPLYDGYTLISTGEQAEKRFDVAFSETLDTLLERDLNVIVVDSLPEPGFDVSNLLARKALLGQPVPDSFQDERPPLQSLGSINSVQDSRFSVLRLNNSLCNVGDCPIAERGEILYFDADHLSSAGSRMLVEPVENALFPNLVKTGFSAALPLRE